MNLYERNQKQREFFNEKIDTYDQVHETYLETKNVLTESLEEGTHRILDLGVGTGLELIHLFEKFPNAEVTAIDITENMLSELSKRSFANKVKTICGDFFEVDFVTDYDAVISTSALHHFTKEEKVTLYAKILRCLRKNGIFINCDKIALTDSIEEAQLFELEHHFSQHKHIDTPLTVEHEIKVLQEAGFEIVESSSVDKDDYRLIKARKK